MLGVCLGHQAIGHVYGATIVGADRADARQDVADRPRRRRRLRRPAVTADGDALPLADDRPGHASPDVLEVTATTADGTIMGVRHRHHDVEGVQFHPESVLTAAGHDLLSNFLARCA